MKKPSLASLSFVALLAVGSLALLASPAGAQETPPPPPPPEGASPTTPGTTTPTPPGGRYLQLPDISFIGMFLGRVSNDRRDTERDRLRFEEGEVGLQSYIYPGIRADVFIVFAEDEAVVEEGFLTVERLPLGNLPLSATVGRRFVPFGRTNQLHPHSQLYTVRPYVLNNLVAGEALAGDGGYLSYLLPTGRVFAQLDLGFWSGGGGHGHGEEEEHDEPEGILSGSGAGFEDRFLTARLWTAFPFLGGDLEIGGSAARGRGETLTFDEEDNGSGEALTALSRRRGRQAFGTVRPTIQLTGLDLTYRRAGRGASRFLLRSEYVRHRAKDGAYSETVDGYYIYADQRLNRQTAVGLRYDWSGFPNAPGLHETAVSLIGTYSLTERSYFRVQLLRGDRPGKSGFTEGWFQWVWGFGPHTHNLE